MSFTDNQRFYDYIMTLPDSHSDVSDSNSEPYRSHDNSDSASEPDNLGSYHSDSDQQSNPDSETHSSDFDGDYPGFYDSDPDTGSPAHSETSETSDYQEYLGPDGKLLESERERRRIHGLCFYCGGEHLRAHCHRLWARDHPDSASEASEPNSEYSGESAADSENSDYDSDY